MNTTILCTKCISAVWGIDKKKGVRLCSGALCGYVFGVCAYCFLHTRNGVTLVFFLLLSLVRFDVSHMSCRVPLLSR